MHLTKINIEKADPDIRCLTRRTVSSRSRDQEVDLRVRAADDVELEYECDDEELYVDDDGIVYVPENYEGTARIVITSDETENYEAAEKTVTLRIR